MGGAGVATIGTINSATAHDKDYMGLRKVVLPLTAVNDGDTLTAGTDAVPTGIVRVAWEPDDTGDQVAVTSTVSVITLSTSGGATAHSGNLHIWCKR